MKHFFGLLTDFGFDFAVASIKGVLLQEYPDAQIIDIDHTIEKFNALNAAFVIEKVYSFLPQGTILLCVVDPGVGSARDLLCIQVDSYRFIGPNNGIFHYLLTKKNVLVHKINTESFSNSSVTFHGRDIFAPAAIALAQGDNSILTPINKKYIIKLDIDKNCSNEGLITYIDSFGNIKTNIAIKENQEFNSKLTLFINTVPYTIKYVRTFTDVSKNELLCYKGSNATLEIAANLNSAKDILNVTVGAKIFIA